MLKNLQKLNKPNVILPLILVPLFFITTLAYSMPLPGNNSLRVPAAQKSTLKRVEETATKLGSNHVAGSDLSRRQFAAAVATPLLPAVSPAQGPLLTTNAPSQRAQDSMIQRIARGLSSFVVKDTGIMTSFQVPGNMAQQVWSQTTNEHERMVLKEGLVIYDGAVAGIFMALAGDLRPGKALVQTLWNGSLGALADLRGSPGIFIYGPGSNPISEEEGKRGFNFKVINAFGNYELIDPRTGKTITWSQWAPVAGENAWAGVIMPLQIYYKEHGTKYLPSILEMKHAEEIARAATFLQADNGGIRMAPKGTWSPAEPGTDPSKYTWMYNEISTENNLSWYSAFRMLYDITRKDIYKNAMDGIERYLKAAYDPAQGIFCQGMHYTNGRWVKSRTFATDCQTWAIDVLGPGLIDKWFGNGAAYKMWQQTKKLAGIFDAQGNLLALDFTDYRSVRQGRSIKSVEWTGGGIVAPAILADYYTTPPLTWLQECEKDASTMYNHMQTLKVNIGNTTVYPYSSERGPTGHGWDAAGRVLSAASTAWMGLVEFAGNPLHLGVREVPTLVRVTRAALDNMTRPKEEVPVVAVAPKSKPAIQQPSSSTESIGEAQTIASHRSGAWSGSGAHSCWANGSFDFSDATHVRLAFPRSKAGVNVFVRLLRNLDDANFDVDRSPKHYTIPANGILDIPLSDFPLTSAQLRKIVQVSVHSGSNAWNIDLNQGQNATADFELVAKIDKRNIQPRKGASVAPVPKSETASVQAVPKKAGSTAEAQTIASRRTGTWSGSGAHSCWADGSFDLSDATYLRLIFPRTQAGVNVFVRLLRNLDDANFDVDRSPKQYAIPANGILDIPITDFPHSKAQLKRIVQISVHSGSNAWNIPLNKGQNAIADFESIDKLTGRNTSSNLLLSPENNRGYSPLTRALLAVSGFGNLRSGI